MGELSNILRSLRGGESLREAAQRLGISHQYLKVLESGVDPRSGDEVKVSAGTIRKISQGYKISYEKLLAAAGYFDSVGMVEEPTTRGMIRVPIVERVSSGAQVLTEENVIGHQLIDAAKVGDGEFFFLHVAGDSMKDMHIVPGSCVLVRRQPFLEDGDVGLILIGSEDATIKKFHRSNNLAILSAANSALNPQILPISDIEILGKVISVTIDF